MIATVFLPITPPFIAPVVPGELPGAVSTKEGVAKSSGPKKFQREHG
jgi:hypothetical protein